MARTDASELAPVFTATLVGVMATLNKACVTQTPREWEFASGEMQASLALTGSTTEASYDAFMDYMNGLIFQDLDDQRSCAHIGCGIEGIDAQALKAVNTFKIKIKAAAIMRSDEDVWDTSTNAEFLDLAASAGHGVIANIDDW